MSDTTDPITGWPVETDPDTDPEAGQGDDSTPDLFTDAELDENGVATPAACFEAMRVVIDPEIGINVVDLGLVYDIQVQDNTAYMQMTLTTMGCPLTELLHTQAAIVLSRMPGIEEAEVEFVFSPPWSTDMISDTAREELRAMGFTL